MKHDKEKAAILRKAKRDELKSLSKMAKIMVNSGQFSTINDALLKFYRDQIDEDDICFYSFQQWEELDYHVAKGSKAWAVWGKPRPFMKDGQPVVDEDGEEPSTYFPICYLFDNTQVIKRPESKPKRKTA